jgi:Rhodopirellula transposase DDE domain
MTGSKNLETSQISGSEEHHTAGSPMNQELKWTNLTRQQIADFLAAIGISVSVTVVDQLLANHQFYRRKAVKTKAFCPSGTTLRNLNLVRIVSYLILIP